MPKTHKPSETTGAPVKEATPAGKAAVAVKASPKAPAGPAKKTAPAAATAHKSVPAAVRAKSAAPAKVAAPAKKPAAAKKHPGAAKVAPAGPASNTAGGLHKPAAAKVVATKAVAAKGVATKADGNLAVAEDDQPTAAFLAEMRLLLVQERAGYVRQADELKAEADSLALEHEPGDVQFDEEGGEGGTSNVDRELDLVLSAQARSAITEIDRALLKIEAGSYGRCEQCGRPIPQARLKALPYAALCVACKSGGLSRR
jgi:RNA polymerase-binding transcription factor DksA